MLDKGFLTEIGAYSTTVTGTALGGAPSFVVGGRSITPQRAIKILEAKVVVYGAEVISGLLIPDLVFETYWDIPTANTPAIPFSGPYNRVYVVGKCGIANQFNVMRDVSAAETFFVVAAANIFAAAPAPANLWFGIAEITLFYTVIN